MFDTDRHHAAQIAAWGRDVVITAGGADYTLPAVFRDPYGPRAVGGAQVVQPHPTLRLQEAEYQLIGAIPGDVVNVDGKTYAIVSVTPHDQGMIELTLAAYS